VFATNESGSIRDDLSEEVERGGGTYAYISGDWRSLAKSRVTRVWQTKSLCPAGNWAHEPRRMLSATCIEISPLFRNKSVISKQVIVSKQRSYFKISELFRNIFVFRNNPNEKTFAHLETF
jgi:hypothetical protein